MPIEYRIDRERRLVIAHGKGVVTHEDVFGYQREVWTRAEVRGFDELVDMTAVTEINLPEAASLSVRQLAMEAAGSDLAEQPSKFAIVAPDRLSYGLGRMYQVYRELEERSTKEVRVFRRLGEAWAFLGVEDPDDAPGSSPDHEKD